MYLHRPEVCLLIKELLEYQDLLEYHQHSYFVFPLWVLGMQPRARVHRASLLCQALLCFWVLLQANKV